MGAKRGTMGGTKGELQKLTVIVTLCLPQPYEYIPGMLSGESYDIWHECPLGLKAGVRRSKTKVTVTPQNILNKCLCHCIHYLDLQLSACEFFLNSDTQVRNW